MKRDITYLVGKRFAYVRGYSGIIGQEVLLVNQTKLNAIVRLVNPGFAIRELWTVSKKDLTPLSYPSNEKAYRCLEVDL